MPPFFSIIIPVYNVAPYISKCIARVLTQSFNNFELILINDGSTDNSLTIIQNFSDPRIRIFNIEHKGPGAARNIGINNAIGKYIWLIDGDDLIAEDALLILHNFLIDSDVDVLAMNAAMIDESDAYKHNHFRLPANFTNIHTTTDFIKINKFCPVYFWTHIYKSSCIQRLAKPIVNEELGSIGDNYFNMNLYSNYCLSWMGVDQELYNYRRRDGSITTNTLKTYNNLYSRLILLSAAMHLYYQKKIPRQLYLSRFVYDINIVKSNIAQVQLSTIEKQTLKNLIRSIKLNPINFLLDTYYWKNPLKWLSVIKYKNEIEKFFN